MLLVFYISSHGLGHVSRSIELIDALTSHRTDGLRIVVRSNAPAWTFERIRTPAVEVQTCDTDSGVTQRDSLSVDEDKTIERAADFYRDFDRRVAEETSYLRQVGANLVVSDIPPLAFEAAHRANVPSIAVANFTWDWIYAYYPQFERQAPGVIGTIAHAYSHAALALRLPFPGGFESMQSVLHEIPFIARRSTRNPVDTRRALGLDSRRLMVLSSFAGHGAALPYDRIAASGLDVFAPDQAPPAGLKYEDLVAAADVVVSKPGYGIVSECIANGTALLYTFRGRFAEQDVFVDDMPRLMRCRAIDRDDLLTGRWDADVDALLRQPPPAVRPRTDGADVAADAIVTFLDR